MGQNEPEWARTGACQFLFLSAIVDGYRLEPFRYTQGGVAIIFDQVWPLKSSYKFIYGRKCVNMGQNEPDRPLVDFLWGKLWIDTGLYPSKTSREVLWSFWTKFDLWTLRVSSFMAENVSTWARMSQKFIFDGRVNMLQDSICFKRHFLFRARC